MGADTCFYVELWRRAMGRDSFSRKADKLFSLWIKVTKISPLGVYFAVFFNSNEQLFNVFCCFFSHGAKGSWKTLWVDGWAFSASMSRCLFFPSWKNNPTWPFHLSLAEVYCPCLPFLLHYCPSLKNGFLCSLCSQGYPVCAAGLANFLCSSFFSFCHQAPRITSAWGVTRPWWDHHLFSDLLQPETPHPWN